MRDPCQFILQFMKCWERFDLEGALSCVAEDASFTPDLVSKPVVGREAIKDLWSFYMREMKDYQMRVVNVVGSSKVVCLERVEYVLTSKQERVTLPIVGVFELDEAHKIKAWRDYVDSTMLP